MFDKTFGNVRVAGGTKLKPRGKKTICPVCGDKIQEGDQCVTIKCLGEMKREYHHACLLKITQFIYDNKPEEVGWHE